MGLDWNSIRSRDKDFSFLYPVCYAVHTLRDTGKNITFLSLGLTQKLKDCEN